MSGTGELLLTAATSGVVCAVAGLAMPPLVARLPEPEPDPEPEEGVELTAAQRARLAEGPKERYVDLASAPGFVGTVVYTSGVAGALIGWAIGLDWLLLLLLLPLAPFGAMLAVVDLRTRLLPARVVLPLTFAALVYGLVAWPVTGSGDALLRGVVGLVVARSLLWVLWFVYPRGMGFGDVRLAAVTGFVLAYVGWAEWAVGVYAPFLIFGLPGAVLALVKWDRELLRKAYPFGPFILVGALIGLLVGDPIIDGLVNR